MVKKTYIIPELTNVFIAQTLLDSTSFEKDSNTITDPNEILVKGNNSSHSSYNVWDDDWSNN